MYTSSITVLIFCLVYHMIDTVHSLVPNLHEILLLRYGSTYCRKSIIQISSTVWIEDAEDGFVDDNENLMLGEKCLKSVKAFAQDTISIHDDDDDDDQEKRFLGAAALAQRPQPFSDIHDCWIADALMDETNAQFKGAIKLLDHLFLFYLQSMKGRITQSPFSIQKVVSCFIVQCGHPDSEYHCASYMAALYRGFKPLKDMIHFDARQGQYAHNFTYLEHLDLQNEDLDAMVFDMSPTGFHGYLTNDINHQEQKEIHDIIMQCMINQQGESFQ